MNTIVKTLAGIAFAAAGIAGPAAAQPRLEQTGDGYGLAYDGPAERGNVAGGRAGRLVGGGEDAAVLYTGPDPATGGGRFAWLSGGGDNAVLLHAAPAPSGRMAGEATGAGGPRG